MNEQKRRGRPPKAVIQVIESPGVREAQALVAAINEAEPAVADEAVNPEFARRQAQAYARRMWDGQSPDLSRHERLGRIAVALEAQGMSMEGVVL